jgi:hypothetical protein|nr:MAG TPA: hypothetical protein [Crassvirales sp.]
MAAVNAYDKITYGEFKLPSLQELMVAPMYMQQLHNKAEEEFLQNQALAADAATRFQPGIDDAAIQANQQFQSSVQADINDLAKNGLTPGIRRRLIQRKTDFTNNILPLNKAAVDREQWAKAAKEAQLRNPSLIIKDPMQVGLDRWIADPTSHELHPISGQEIYERTRQAMIPISKYISQNLPQLARTGLPFQYFTIAQSGATAEEIATLMGRQYKDIDPRLLSPLANLIKDAADSVVTSTGVYDYYGVDSNEARRVNEYAASAFSHALGTKSFGNMSDRYGMEMSLLRAKLAAKGQEEAGLPSIRGFNYTKVGETAEGKAIDKRIKALNDLKKEGVGLSRDEIIMRLQKAKGDAQSYAPSGDPSVVGSKPVNSAKYNNAIRDMQKYEDLLETLDMYEASDVDKALEGLQSDRNALVQRYKFYSPDLTSSEMLTNIIKDYFATQTDDELPLLDSEYNPNKNIFGSERTVGYNGKFKPEEFFNKDVRYQYSPGFGIVATNGENKVIIKPEMLGDSFTDRYNMVQEMIDQLLETRPEGYGEAIGRLSMGLVNSVKNEQAILNQIIGKTSSKANE